LDATEQLNKALDMMNNAVSGGHSQPGARENVAYLASTERRRDFESLPASALSGQEVSWNDDCKFWQPFSLVKHMQSYT